jgi:diacylglycerol kinase (ATP)
MYSFLKSFTYASKGIKVALSQRNMRVHILCAIIAIVTAYILSISLTEWCIILICIGIVLSLEIINTAIEALVDLVEPNQNPIAGKVKDLAAGAVLVFSIISTMIAIMIFGKYILDLLYY